MADRRNRRDFTRAEVCELLDYDPLTGIFRWKISTNSRGKRIQPGDEAGTLKDGYIQIKVFGRVYRAQHLAWLIMTGEWPPVDIDVDHENRNRAYNAWRNLRLATRSQNNMNMGLRSDNKSGQKGVGRRKDTGRWYARVTVDRKIILLGHFDTFDEAAAARKAAEQRYFGEFSAA
ncbi:HNH endonuclease signature motif containing protein [Shinella sp.]|uniref:HNH endonuclease signature motif containing protein n=1 Tax=Shinella sp. TaxID=1870904 RepID=UPI0028A1461C|nr:HNH endonuclease signature motif containing protein [Shinella sp.]